MFYDLNDGSPGTSGWTAGLMVAFLCLRLLACPPWLLTYGNQVIIFIAGLLIPIPFLILSVMRYMCGAPLRDLQPEYSSMKRKPGGLTRRLNDRPGQPSPRSQGNNLSPRGRGNNNNARGRSVSPPRDGPPGGARGPPRGGPPVRA